MKCNTWYITILKLLVEKITWINFKKNYAF